MAANLDMALDDIRRTSGRRRKVQAAPKANNSTAQRGNRDPLSCTLDELISHRTTPPSSKKGVKATQKPQAKQRGGRSVPLPAPDPRKVSKKQRVAKKAAPPPLPTKPRRTLAKETIKKRNNDAVAVLSNRATPGRKNGQRRGISNFRAGGVVLNTAAAQGTRNLTISRRRNRPLRLNAATTAAVAPKITPSAMPRNSRRAANPKAGGVVRRNVATIQNEAGSIFPTQQQQEFSDRDRALLTKIKVMAQLDRISTTGVIKQPARVERPERLSTLSGRFSST